MNKDKRTFESGAQRDSNEGKIRPDLISPYMLKALGKVLADGATHYGERNWEKGMPLDIFKESAARHYVQWMANETDEDHAAKLIFNVMAFIHFRDKPIDVFATKKSDVNYIYKFNGKGFEEKQF